jgi:hypothetical protein
VPEPVGGPRGFGPVDREADAAQIAVQLSHLDGPTIRSIERGPAAQLVRFPVIVFTDDEAAAREAEQRARVAWVVTLVGAGPGDCQDGDACPTVPTIEHIGIDAMTGALLIRTLEAEP